MIENNWIALSLLASVFQVFRNSYSKSLKNSFSDSTITAIRFIFGFPFIVIIYFIFNKFSFNFYWLTQTSLLFVSTGSLFQILGTFFILRCFQFRNFATGVTFSKLEAIFAALISSIFFADPVKKEGLYFIFLAFIGIVFLFSDSIKLLSLKNKNQLKCSIYGLICGICFATSSVLFRHANITLISIDSTILRGINTLFISITLQTIIMIIYLIATNKKFILQHKKSTLIKSTAVGFFGISASCCWFIAFGIANAAYVKTVGQIEILFSIIITVIIFKEKIKINEIIAISITIISILGLNYI